MISVLTITYKRHHLLEEAIESFLQQIGDNSDCEMVVVNDNPEVDYQLMHPNVRIINHKERFPSIAAKLQYGYQLCENNYIYRLDDDDLLAPWALMNVKKDILENPGYEIYRSRGMYFFSDNKFQNESSNINNGNIYTREYLDRITWPDKSGNEDDDITFGHKARIYESKLAHTMLYRWGMNTLHISGMGVQPNDVILAQADKVLDNTTGDIWLTPKFMNDYYEQLPVDMLTFLANKMRTDKGTLPDLGGHGYTLTYHKLFKHYRKRYVKMMEIGIFDPRFPGASVRVWKNYFPVLRFTGFDINPAARVLEQEGINIYIGDQSKASDLNHCVMLYGDGYDIIIDDGSHVGEHILSSFVELFPHLKAGGFYIIEDLHSVYTKADQLLPALDEAIASYNFQIREKYSEHGGKLLIIRKAL